VRELVVASGKGGTGKTSIAVSLAVLAGRVVVADCDVDAANLNLDLSRAAERMARARRLPVVGRVSYDPAVTAAQVAGRSVVEEGGRAAAEIVALWKNLKRKGDVHVIS
jgi:MinD superfamily P-loop ATPase